MNSYRDVISIRAGYRLICMGRIQEISAQVQELYMEVRRKRYVEISSGVEYYKV